MFIYLLHNGKIPREEDCVCIKQFNEGYIVTYASDMY
jgi:hypothetical protein